MMNTKALIALAALGLASSVASAGSIDLTARFSSGSLDGALFEQVNPRPTGTGVIHSFLRIQNKDSEAGYNTDAKNPPFDAKKGNFTRSLLLSDLAVTEVNGTDYRQFLLDLNESNSKNGPYIDLTDLKIFLGTTGDHATTNVDSLGTLVYDLDGSGDNTVHMYDWGSGSGSGDYLISIPDSLFQAAFDGSNPNVYLYSAFSQSDGGFEEWAALTGDGHTPVPIPLPAAAWSGLAMLGAVALGGVRRRLTPRAGD